MADSADLKFVIRADAGQARDELGRFTAKVKADTLAAEESTKRVGAGATLSLAEQAKAAESLQRQRSTAILSIMKAMEGDIGKSAAQVAQNHSLTDKLIADSQRSIVQMERAFQNADLALAKTGERIAIAETEAAGLAGQWGKLASFATGPLAIGIGVGAAAIAGMGLALYKFINDTAEAWGRAV